MKTHAIGCALLIATSALPVTLHAQDFLQQLGSGRDNDGLSSLSAEQQAALLNQVDPNHDGLISKAEFQQAGKLLTDAQKLGLSQDRFEAMQQQALQLLDSQPYDDSWTSRLKRKLLTKMADAGNTGIDEQQVSRMVDGSFDRFDSNRDGYLDSAEQAQLQQEMLSAGQRLQSLLRLLGK